MKTEILRTDKLDLLKGTLKLPPIDLTSKRMQKTLHGKLTPSFKEE